MHKSVKLFALLIFVAWVGGGCATSTVETRKKERATGYAALAPEERGIVDQGQIKMGMSMDAVYIAWGKPTQILSGESAGGATITWVYAGTTMREYRVWNYRHVPGSRYRAEPYIDFDYVPSNYTRAEVVFENGLVKSWRTMAPRE